MCVTVQYCAVGEHNCVLAFQKRLHEPDMSGADDIGPMDPEKRAWVQCTLQLRERLLQDIRLLPDVDSDTRRPVGTDPVDVIAADDVPRPGFALAKCNSWVALHVVQSRQHRIET